MQTAFDRRRLVASHSFKFSWQTSIRRKNIICVKVTAESILAKKSQEALGNAVTGERSSHMSTITWYLWWLFWYEKVFALNKDKFLAYLAVGKCGAWLLFCASHN